MVKRMRKTILFFLVFVLVCLFMIFMYMRHFSLIKTLVYIVVITFLTAFISKKLNHTDILVILASILTAYLVSEWVCDRYIMFPL